MGWFTPATLLLIGWGALAFGAEYPWAYAPLLVFGATVGGLGLAARVPGADRNRALALALGLVVAAGCLQAAPLPATLVSALSPARAAHDWAALYANAMPAALYDAGPSEAAFTSLSLEPSRTALGLTFVAGLTLFFLGAARALTAGGLPGITRGLIVLGVVVALVGIAQVASGSLLVYGVWPPRKAWGPAAPFINPNHFAGWMLMALPMAAAYLGWRIDRALRHAPRTWRERTIRLASEDGNEIVLAAFAVVLMALSILVTASVSGMFCLAAVAGALAWRASRGRTGWRRRMLPAAGLAGMLLLATVWAGAGAVSGEIEGTLATALTADGRVGIWRDTLHIIGDFPLTGAGFNTYGIAMLGYQTQGLEMRAVEAHNDYLQLAAEGGLLVGLPIIAAVAAFVREVRRRFREARDDARTRWLRVGAIIGIGALGLQSLVDFSLQIPGNAVLFTLLMAVAVHRPGAPGRPGEQARHAQQVDEQRRGGGNGGARRPGRRNQQ